MNNQPKQSAVEILQQQTATDIEGGKKLFDLWVNCNLCIESGAYSWNYLMPVRQLNWIDMARRIRHGELS